MTNQCIEALLLTFGCDAVFPYMAYEALRVLGIEGKRLAPSSGQSLWRCNLQYDRRL